MILTSDEYPVQWQDEAETTWARLITGHAGAGRGSLMLPEVGDEVAIAFEGGDPERPYIVGSLWNGVQQPPTQGFWEGGTNGGEFAGNNIKRLVTKSGHRITTVDTSGQETLTAATPKSTRFMRRVSPEFEPWRQKVIQMLKDRGVKFPVQHPSM